MIVNFTLDVFYNLKKVLIWGLPWWLSGKESTSQCRKLRFDPWSRRIPHALEKLNPCSTTIEPVLQSTGAAAIAPMHSSYRSPCAQSPSSAREATIVTSLCTTREQPLPLQLENSPHSNKDPTEPRSKYINIKNNNLIICFTVKNWIGGLQAKAFFPLSFNMCSI